MRAVQITRPGEIGEVALDDKALLNPSAGWLTIEVAASGICGTDLHIFQGEYMGEYPIIPGHEFSGKVVALGEGVNGFSLDERVAVEPNLSCGICSECRENRQHFCKNWRAVGVTMAGSMATHVLVPQKAVYSTGGLDYVKGAFMEPLSCVVHGVTMIGPSLGDRILILGAGPIGMLLFRVLRASGAAYIDVAEKNPGRAAFAEESGADRIYHDLANVPGGKYDIVVDATGAIPVMEQSILLVRPAGRVLFFGVPPKGVDMKIEAFRVFSNELTLMAPFTSLRNSRQAIDLMKSGQVRVDDLVSHTFPLQEFQQAIEMLLNPTEPVMKVMIDPRL